MYDLYKTGIDNKELLEELSLDISRAVKKLLKELTVFVANLDLI